MCGTCQNLEFVKQRDGAEAACAFARQAVNTYRTTVLSLHGLIARRAMIEAYLCSKKYLLTCQQV
jgi:hypothetical protein